MCDPTISSCPAAVNDLPVCYSEPEVEPIDGEDSALACTLPEDTYMSMSSETSGLESFDVQGMLGYFQEQGPLPEAGLNLPVGQDLLFADYADQFPASIRPYLVSLQTLQAQVPEFSVSFRVVQVVTPEGQTFNQIVFFRTGTEPAVASVSRGGGTGTAVRTGGNGVPTRVPTVNGMMVGTIGGVATIVAFDRLLLEELVDRDILPQEFRTPVLFGSAMTAHAALYRAGLIDVSPAEGLRAMPAFLGYQTMGRWLIQGAAALACAGGESEEPCIDMNDPFVQGGSLVLASLPFVWARIILQNQAVAEIEAELIASRGAAAAGRFLASAEGEAYVAEQLAARGVSRAALAEAAGANGLSGLTGLSRAAVTLRVTATFARALGRFLIVTLGAEIGLGIIGWAHAHLSSGDTEDNMRLWRLVRLSTSTVDQQRWGEFGGSLLGPLATFAAVTRTWGDEEFDEWYDAQIEAARDEYVRGSDEFGTSLHQSIVAILSQNMRAETPASERPVVLASLGHVGELGETRWTINWSGVRDDLESFYDSDENEDNIEKGYELVDDYTAPMTTSGIAELIEIVDEDGEIENLEDFKDHFRIHVSMARFQAMRRLDERSEELGLIREIGGVRVNMLTQPGFIPTAEQEAFLRGEGLELTSRIVYGELFLDALGGVDL